MQKEHVEALLRSLLLVFMDNSTAEYSFVSTFFASQKSLPPPDSPHLPAAGSILSPDGGTFTELQSPSDSEFDGPRPMSSTTPGLGGFVSFVAKSKEEQATIDGIWKQVMDPVMEYCTVSQLSCQVCQSLIPSQPLDLCSVDLGSYTACHPTSYHDPTSRRRCCRNSKTPLPSCRNIHVRPESANVACFSKGDDRTRRKSEEIG